ncbi:hypothetical protein K435DRAFT_862143 [Dendrothele bispora CBS 962.96]|uniref:Uncharacterized protein n=1 Tax=Dendrothele bispora (strain CBS 962.96) TaxID=1314807 RepID=A0A4S8LUS0_DENBC|nr:hypothetical protein K435DRAFT_862143 [Dendrothele bispora CBS 962.96]
MNAIGLVPIPVLVTLTPSPVPVPIWTCLQELRLLVPFGMATRCQLLQLLQSGFKATGVQHTLSSTSPKQTVNGHLSIPPPPSPLQAPFTYPSPPVPIPRTHVIYQLRNRLSPSLLPLHFSIRPSIPHLLPSIFHAISNSEAYKTSGYKGTGPGFQADDTVLKSYQSICTTIIDDFYPFPSSGQI